MNSSLRPLPRLALAVSLALAGAGAVPAAPSAAEPLRPRVVVISYFEIGEDIGDKPGEFQHWVEREKLTEVLPLPAAYHPPRHNAEGTLLALCAGMGTARATASMMALGLDPRLDLSKSYFLIAGIAGVDPADASLGSAAWAQWVVDGDLAHEIDAREMPAGWTTGYIPLRRHFPYEKPADRSGGAAYRLDPGLVEWAFQMTKDIPLDDTEAMAVRRALYTETPAAQRPPFVLKGDTLSAMTYWHGKYLNQWANDWVRYYSDERGNYVTTAMEDTGVLQALTWLDRAGRADLRRVLVLRTASNFDMQWPGGDAASSLSGEKLGPGYSALLPALDHAHRLGSKVVHTLIEGWERYSTQPPSATLPGVAAP